MQSTQKRLNKEMEAWVARCGTEEKQASNGCCSSYSREKQAWWLLMEERSSQVNFKGEANNSQRYRECQLSWARTPAGSKLSWGRGRIKRPEQWVPACRRTDQKDRPEASIIQMKCNREIITGDHTAGTRTVVSQRMTPKDVIMVTLMPGVRGCDIASE